MQKDMKSLKGHGNPPRQDRWAANKSIVYFYNEKSSRINDQEAENSSEKSLSLAMVLDLSYFSNLEPFGLNRPF